MAKKRGLTRIVSLFILMCICFTACGWERSDISNKTRQLEEYSATHAEFTLFDIYGDAWDIAYLDPMNYGSGGYIRWKYGLDFEVESDALSNRLNYETQRCVFFFKDNQLAFTIVTEILPRSLEVIYPDTILYRDNNEGVCGYYDKRTLNYSLSVNGNTIDDYVDAIRNDPTISKYVEYGKNGNSSNGLPLNEPFQRELNEVFEWDDGINITLYFDGFNSIVEIVMDKETNTIKTIERYWPEKPI